MTTSTVNAFVHRRVLAYKQRGLDVDVFRLRSGTAMSFHEYEDVDWVSGSQEALEAVLRQESHESILVHFLNEAMWDVIRPYLASTRVTVWIHGSEIQPWHRRKFNYVEDDGALAEAVAASDRRVAFWRDVLTDPHPNLKFVFVSQYFAEEVMTDIGVRLADDTYTIVHNPIDTDLFAYHEKPPEQRLRILSIRPYASAKYANDLSVAAILSLQDEEWFNDVEFRLVGAGPLFDSTLAPLVDFDNVILENRFLSQAEIAALHREYGVFLNPTRMDAQGVSRDEAMSSGLVPVTTDVAAIPEFVDDDSGFLAPPEDHVGLADAIRTLYEEPQLFQRKSQAAAQRVRSQSAVGQITDTEVQIILGGDIDGADTAQ